MRPSDARPAGAKNDAPAPAANARGGSPWVLEASSGVGGRYTCSGIAPEKIERRGGRGTIRNAIADFKAHPDKYVAMRY